MTYPGGMICMKIQWVEPLNKDTNMFMSIGDKILQQMVCLKQLSKTSRMSPKMFYIWLTANIEQDERLVLINWLDHCQIDLLETDSVSGVIEMLQNDKHNKFEGILCSEFQLLKEICKEISQRKINKQIVYFCLGNDSMFKQIKQSQIFKDNQIKLRTNKKQQLKNYMKEKNTFQSFIFRDAQQEKSIIMQSTLSAMLIQPTNRQFMIYNFQNYALKNFKQQRQNIQQVISVLNESTLDHKKIIRIYTKQTFFYKLINRIFKISNDPFELFYVQVGVQALYSSILSLYRLQQKKDKYRSQKVCFRGSRMTDNQIEKFRANIGREVQSLGFLSTSVEFNIAKLFAINVILEIQIQDSQRIQFQQFSSGFAFIQNISEASKQKQILFNALNQFLVLSVKYDSNQNLTIIKLKYGKAAKIMHNYKTNGTVRQQEIEQIRYLMKKKYLDTCSHQFLVLRSQSFKQNLIMQYFIFLVQAFSETIFKSSPIIHPPTQEEQSFLGIQYKQKRKCPSLNNIKYFLIFYNVIQSVCQLKNDKRSMEQYLKKKICFLQIFMANYRENISKMKKMAIIEQKQYQLMYQSSICYHSSGWAQIFYLNNQYTQVINQIETVKGIMQHFNVSEFQFIWYYYERVFPIYLESLKMFNKVNKISQQIKKAKSQIVRIFGQFHPINEVVSDKSKAYEVQDQKSLSEQNKIQKQIAKKRGQLAQIVEQIKNIYKQRNLQFAIQKSKSEIIKYLPLLGHNNISIDNCYQIIFKCHLATFNYYQALKISQQHKIKSNRYDQHHKVYSEQTISYIKSQILYFQKSLHFTFIMIFMFLVFDMKDKAEQIIIYFEQIIRLFLGVQSFQYLQIIKIMIIVDHLFSNNGQKTKIKQKLSLIKSRAQIFKQLTLQQCQSKILFHIKKDVETLRNLITNKTIKQQYFDRIYNKLLQKMEIYTKNNDFLSKINQMYQSTKSVQENRKTIKIAEQKCLFFYSLFLVHKYSQKIYFQSIKPYQNIVQNGKQNISQKKNEGNHQHNNLQQNHKSHNHNHCHHHQICLQRSLLMRVNSKQQNKLVNIFSRKLEVIYSQQQLPDFSKQFQFLYAIKTMKAKIKLGEDHHEECFQLFLYFLAILKEDEDINNLLKTKTQ